MTGARQKADEPCKEWLGTSCRKLECREWRGWLLYTIEIDEYPVFVRLGYYAQERLVGQDIRVSLSLQLDASIDLGGRDDLAATLDYGAVLRRIDALVAGQEIRLVETVVDKLGHGLLAAFAQLAGVSVQVTKPLLPAGVGRGAGITVSRRFSRESARCAPPANAPHPQPGGGWA